MTREEAGVAPADIRAAMARIAGHVRRTPAWTLPPGALGPDGAASQGGCVSLKLELFQHAGSFKARGAFNALLSAPVPAAGVTAASGGNHGAAVAFAARSLGVPARIFVPEIASPAKVAAIRAFGAEIVIGGARYADAQEACDRHAETSGARLVHPFAAAATIAGQGTLAFEWEEQAESAPLPDTVLVAVGGGGLISGIATWWRGRGVKVVGVEPEGSCALHAALAAGRPVDVGVESVAADSLGARNVGERVFALCTDGAVDHVALVADDAISAAQVRLWQDWRIATEPGGATALAALTSGAYRPAKGERVGVLVCGGNVDLARLAALSEAVP
jgi:threonine dehydratase